MVEALARSGVGLDLFDGDTVAFTNINRQIIALENTVGRPKVEVAQERVLLIDPQCRVEAASCSSPRKTPGKWTSPAMTMWPTPSTR